MTRTRPRPKKNQRHSVRSIVVSAAMPVERPMRRTMVVICVSRTRSKIVISIAPSTTPPRLPAPPSTTMHSSMIDTWNSKAPGVMACSLAAYTEPANPENDAPSAKASSLVVIGLTPVQSAAVSSSRMAIQARPSRESCRRRIAHTRGGADDQDQEVPGDRVGLEGHAGQVGTAHRVHAVLAAGEVEPHDGAPAADVDGDVAEVANRHRDDLAEPQRDDGQVVAAHAQRGRADHQAQQRRHRGGHPDAQPEAPRVAVERRAEDRRVQEPHGVGADGEEGGVAEVEQARVADHDVEAQRQQHVDHAVGHRVDGVQADGAIDERVDHQAHRQRDPAERAAAAGGHAITPCRESARPAGRGDGTPAPG